MEATRRERRGHAHARWQKANDDLDAEADRPSARRAHGAAFWDWAVLELPVQSGLRVREARRLAALGVLKRRTREGRTYYMLHVGPSKYDRARVVPIGDGLGRVVAEIVRHVRRFYGAEAVPPCDNLDPNHKRPLPRAPYLLQGRRLPGAIGTDAISDGLRGLAAEAGARKSDGSPLRLTPHDCRRVFASEHLNNGTPIHVVQALLGHATPGTVMVYAKLYPSRLVEEYRKAVRGAYAAVHGQERLRNPTAEEWAAFERAAGCATWAPTCARCPPGSTDRGASCASAASTPGPRRAPRPSSSGCSPATDGSSRR